jgi:hypothetical protein
MPTVEPGTGALIPDVPKLSRLQFRWRYTLDEQVAIELAERSHGDPIVRATLAVLRMSLAEATDVDVADPRTVAGVQYHAAVGLIAPERVPEILSPPQPAPA